MNLIYEEIFIQPKSEMNWPLERSFDIILDKNGEAIKLIFRNYIIFVKVSIFKNSHILAVQNKADCGLDQNA